jgi:hypothetical protein
VNLLSSLSPPNVYCSLLKDTQSRRLEWFCSMFVCK